MSPLGFRVGLGATLAAQWPVCGFRRYGRVACCAAVFAALAAALTALPAGADGEWRTGWPAGQPSGNVTVLAAHPRDGLVAYGGTPAGLYRTTNGGASWTVLSGGLGDPFALVAAPGDPATLYAYTEVKEGDSTGGTLWRSDDGGQLWSDRAGGRADGMLRRLNVLLVDGDSRDVLLAAVGRGGAQNGRLLKSTDSGATWREVYAVQSPLTPGQVNAIVQAPADRRVLYAGHSVYHGGALLRSDDRGETWSTLPAPPEPLAYPVALAVAPGDSQDVYAALELPMGGGTRLYRSQDGGRSWAKLGLGLPSAGSFGTRLVVDRNDGRRMFLSLLGEGAGVYASYDGGASWAVLGAGSSAPRSVAALALSPSGRLLYAATPEGIWQIDLPPTLDWGVDARFADFYRAHDGLRVLGRPLSGPMIVNGYNAQYFEKGRIEDHRAETADPDWRFQYGLLTDELQQRQAAISVGGDVSTATYATIARAAAAERRVAPPVGFTSGVVSGRDGSVFVPFSAELRPAAGHTIPARFWSYVNRRNIFPGGWLHDVGLPITEPLSAVVDKGEMKARQITIQAFQRTVLTDDPLNPPDWRVERANVGADFLKSTGGS